MATILLVDNGSTRPLATLQLRQIAKDLSERVGQTIHPVSLQHADAIGVLNGLAVDTFVLFLDRYLAQGERHFIVLPLFFGPSRALSSFIPKKVEELRNQYGDFICDIAPVLYPLPVGEVRLIEILLQCAKQMADQIPSRQAVLVDHGSSVSQVTAVRQHIAGQLQDRLDGWQLGQAAMEGDKSFGDKTNTLADWLKNPPAAQILVLMLFLLPGRHAGPGGDVEMICAKAKKNNADLKIMISPLIGEHELISEILQSRLEKVGLRK